MDGNTGGSKRRQGWEWLALVGAAVQKPRTGQNRGGTADGGGGRGSGEFDGGGGVVPAACLGNGKGPAPAASDRERREKRRRREKGRGFTGLGNKALKQSKQANLF